MSCKIGSLNVRGLGNKIKRKAIFQYLRDKQLDIVFIQESHITNSTVEDWQNEWGCKWQCAMGNSWSGGTCILTNNKWTSAISQVQTDPNGRYVMCTLQMEETKLTLCNLYAPNVDDPRFFVNLLEKVNEYENEHVIIGGDFNLVMEPEMDRLNSKFNHTKSQKIIETFIEDNYFSDIWRDRNPEENCYTWFGRHPVAASRIDMFLIDSGLANLVKETNINKSCRTDHALITMLIQDPNHKRGPGVWKLNNGVLGEEKFRTDIESIIKSNGAIEIDPFTKWEHTKFSCIKYAKNYTKKRAKDKWLLLNNLYKLYDQNIQNVEAHCTINSMAHAEVVDKIKELEDERTNASMFRSRYKYYNEGEKCTKYFMGLEKRNYNKKNMFTILLDDGTVCTEQKEILNEQRKFYEKLYTKDESISFALNNTANVRLTPEQQSNLDREITAEELFDAVNGMKRNKVPGISGLTVEFYVTFWQSICPLLMEAYQHARKTGKLYPSARKGLMSLIPKAKKDSRQLKHMRPLTLLEIDFKILARTMALRMKTVLPDIIGNQQTGFMEKRQLSTNVRKTIDLITHVNKTRQRALVISIDFEKCFDRIEHESMFKALEYFNFGPSFITWVKLFFADFQICTQNAGYLSPMFSKTRGCNQGCPISPFCFLVCGEIMAHLIINNPLIKGIKMNNAEMVISQFADDTGLFIEYSEVSLGECVKVLTCVEANMGLKVSYEKTCIYRIGSLQHSNARLYTTKNFKWSDGDIEMLGVVISNKPQQTCENYNSTIDKMNAVMKTWSHRKLTIIGKVLIINSLMTSLFVHKMSVLPPMSESQNKRVEEIIKLFLWKGRRPKIPNRVLELGKHTGGLKLSNLQKRYKSLRLKWIQTLDSNTDMQGYVYQWLIPKLGKLVWECNLRKNEVAKICSITSYWTGVLEDWCELHFHQPQSEDQIREQILWYNSHIKIGGSILTLSDRTNRLFEKGLIRFEDILNENDVVMSLNEMIAKYGNIGWLWYRQLVNAIPKNWFEFTGVDTEFLETIEYVDIVNGKKISGILYKEMINRDREKIMLQYAKKMELTLDVKFYEMDIYYNMFKTLYKITDSVKLRSFQYRLLLGKIFTNDILYKWKLVDSENCDFCKNVRQTTVHLLFDCKVSRNIWKIVQKICPDIHITLTDVIVNNQNSSRHIYNLVILITKQYLFRCKCEGKLPNESNLRSAIKEMYIFEKINAIKRLTMRKFELRWSPIMNSICL